MIFHVSMPWTTISSSYNAFSYLVCLVNPCLDCSDHHLLFKTFLTLLVYYFLLLFLYSVSISIITWNLLCCNYLLICVLPLVDCKYVKVLAMPFVPSSISSAMNCTVVHSKHMNKKNHFFQDESTKIHRGKY